MNTNLIIPSRFNGPPNSGNGGYSCGVLAAFIDGPARVRLHVPPPLDTPMSVLENAPGAVEMHAGDVHVGSAWAAPLELETPAAPTVEQAEEARSRYACYEGHVFPSCFVCGPGRPLHDGLELFPGPVDDWSLLASSWRPASDLCDVEGFVRPEIVWAALDCPGYFACMGPNPKPAVLGELCAELNTAVPGGEDLVVYAWHLGEQGRKLYAGSALADRRGKVLARARATWILLRE